MIPKIHRSCQIVIMPTCTALIKSTSRKGTLCGAKTAKLYKDTGQIYWLCGKHNKMFRVLSTPVQHMPKITVEVQTDGSSKHCLPVIYPNQAMAADAILAHFARGVRAVGLAAQMQSGKSGTCKDVIAKFNVQHDYNAMTVVILPINDNELLNQAHAEFGAYVMHGHIHGAMDLQCSQYLNQIRSGNPGKPLLIILDESHYGSEKGGSLEKYFSSADIGLDGCALPYNVFLLTVSATPNSETAMLTHKGVARRKQIVVLHPGLGYYGISKMFANGNIHEGWSLATDDGMNDLVALCVQYSTLKKYSVIRCNDSHRINELRQRVGDNIDVRFIPYDYKNKDIKDINNILRNAPTKYTIIAIARRLSASKQMCTDHICLCFDYSDGEISTSMQGLIGRCCGYGKENHKVNIYVNVKYARIYKRWADEDFPPEGTPNDKYVTKGVSGMLSDEWEKNTPRVLDITTIAPQTVAGGKGNYEAITGVIKELVLTQYPDLSPYGQPLKGNGVMILDSGNKESTWKMWWHDLMLNIDKGTKCIGYPRTLKEVQGNIGYNVFINAVEHTAVMTYTQRQNPRGTPLVDTKCVYRPEILPQEVLLKLSA